MIAAFGEALATAAVPLGAVLAAWKIGQRWGWE